MKAIRTSRVRILVSQGFCVRTPQAVFLSSESSCALGGGSPEQHGMPSVCRWRTARCHSFISAICAAPFPPISDKVMGHPGNHVLPSWHQYQPYFPKPSTSKSFGVTFLPVCVSRGTWFANGVHDLLIWDNYLLQSPRSRATLKLNSKRYHTFLKLKSYYSFLLREFKGQTLISDTIPLPYPSTGPSHSGSNFRCLPWSLCPSHTPARALPLSCVWTGFLNIFCPHILFLSLKHNQLSIQAIPTRSCKTCPYFSRKPSDSTCTP